MPDWNSVAKRTLRSEMTKRGIRYAELAQRLNEDGGSETTANLRNKFSRGSFTAAFFLQCLAAMGVTTLRLDE